MSNDVDLIVNGLNSRLSPDFTGVVRFIFSDLDNTAATVDATQRPVQRNELVEPNVTLTGKFLAFASMVEGQAKLTRLLKTKAVTSEGETLAKMHLINALNR